MRTREPIARRTKPVIRDLFEQEHRHRDDKRRAKIRAKGRRTRARNKAMKAAA